MNLELEPRSPRLTRSVSCLSNSPCCLPIMKPNFRWLLIPTTLPQPLAYCPCLFSLLHTRAICEVALLTYCCFPLLHDKCQDSKNVCLHLRSPVLAHSRHSVFVEKNKLKRKIVFVTVARVCIIELQLPIGWVCSLLRILFSFPLKTGSGLQY